MNTAQKQAVALKWLSRVLASACARGKECPVGDPLGCPLKCKCRAAAEDDWAAAAYTKGLGAPRILHKLPILRFEETEDAVNKLELPEGA